MIYDLMHPYIRNGTVCFSTDNYKLAIFLARFLQGSIQERFSGCRWFYIRAKKKNIFNKLIVILKE